MKRATLLIGAALALTSAWAVAQDSPESLLPPGFEQPAQKRNPAPAPAASPSIAPDMGAISGPVVQPIPGGSRGSGGGARPAAAGAGPRLPSIAELEKLSAEDLDQLLGLKPRADIPAAARRSMKQIGVLGAAEGGFASGSLAGQNASLIRAALAGNKGPLVSRWGHILLRRALASRLDAPAGMSPADFTAQRAALLVRMGEGEAARALVQDIDPGNYTPDLTQAAIDAYVATADFTGICPVAAIVGDGRKDPQWEVSQAICTAFQGEGNVAMSRLDRALSAGKMPQIDVLLAQKYAGAAGRARRAVKVEWDNVADMTPWRYGLTIAVGLQPPAALMQKAGPRYDYMAATAPMLPLPVRAAAADRAGGAGVLSSQAMVDLYSQIYADQDISGDWATRAAQLRDSYVGADPAARLAAMKQLWDSAAGPDQRYSRMVLTAYAAARLPAQDDLAGSADAIVGSMLAAGLDRNAMRWAQLADMGSPAWGMLVLAAPSRSALIEYDQLDGFHDKDDSEERRRSGLLLAGLAGLGRTSPEAAREFADKLEIDMNRQTRWSRTIDKAAEVNNAALVALLAGVGMQGDNWSKMTPMHLYHIVAALTKVGLEAEARMIAAEAVARG